MKTLKALSLSLLASALVAGSASAAAPGTILHVAGSTAFRSPATAAMIDYLKTTLSGTNTVHAVYLGSSLLGGSSAILANGTLDDGTHVGTATIAIETYWTGSLAGLVDLVSVNSVGSQYLTPATLLTDGTATTFNSSTVVTTISGTVGYGGGTSLSSTSTTSNSAPDMIFSDSNKSTIKAEVATATMTGTVGSFSTIAALANACGNSTTVKNAGSSGGANGAQLVGVVPFEWVVGNITSSTDIPTNMSQQNANSLISNGFLAESQFTGTNTTPDTTNYFYLTGRNEDSGTRIGSYMEAQFGVVNAPQQFAVATTTSGTVTTVSGASLVPVTALNTEPNIKWNTAGHSGQASGGNVASTLRAVENTTPITFSDSSSYFENTGASYFIGYLGITDASTATASGGGHALTYAGVPFSVANVQNGSYTFWTFEHAYYLGTLTGGQKTAADAIADNIYFTDADITSGGLHQAVVGGASAGILFDSNFNVSRSFTEGGPITHN